MSAKFSLLRDIGGSNSFVISPSDEIYSIVLTNIGGAKSFTLPESAPRWVILFSIESGGQIYVSYDGQDATPPTETGFIKTNSEGNPTARVLLAGKTISCITTDETCKLTLTLYALSQ